MPFQQLSIPDRFSQVPTPLLMGTSSRVEALRPFVGPFAFLLFICERAVNLPPMPTHHSANAFTVGRSSIAGAGHGLFAAVPIEAEDWIGPYNGVHLASPWHPEARLLPGCRQPHHAQLPKSWHPS